MAFYNKFCFSPKYGRIGILEFSYPLFNIITHARYWLECPVNNHVTNVSLNTEQLYGEISQFKIGFTRCRFSHKIAIKFSRNGVYKLHLLLGLTLPVTFVTQAPGQNPIFDFPSCSKSTLPLIGSKVAGVPLMDKWTLHHGHTARFELPAIFYCSYKSAPGHHLTLIAIYDTAILFFLFFSLFFKYIKHKCEPSSKL